MVPSLLLAIGAAPGALAQDSDGDGVDDITEDLVGTDPDDWDSDGDSLPDGAELYATGTDPLVGEVSCLPWTVHRAGRGSGEVGYLADADLDGDGDRDVVGYRNDELIVWEHHADGLSPGRVLAADRWHGGPVVGGDADGDGRDDLFDYVDELEVLYATDTHHVTRELLLDEEGSPPYLPLDLDNDGLTGLITVVDGYPDTVQWLRPAPGRVFEDPVPLMQPSHNWATAIAVDLDGDGDEDVLTESASLLNDGGTLVTGASVPVLTILQQAVDVDGDGRLDAVGTISVAGSTTEKHHLWVRQRGDGTFAPPKLLPEHRGLYDIDGDGLTDLLPPREDGGGFLRGLGGGRFDPEPLWLPDIGPWAFHASDLDGDGGVDFYERPKGSVQIYLNPYVADTDGDGLRDHIEVCHLGTDPLLADTDGGGETDRDELLRHAEPTSLVDDQLPLDTDGDTLSDHAETYVHGSDPAVADSDGDGLDDGEELSLGTSPTRLDSDGDGIDDGDEASDGTDPARRDTDGDGRFDGEEIEALTDPLIADTDGDGFDDGLEHFYGTDPLMQDADADADGLPDTVEALLGTDELLADTDADGLTDGEEVVVHADPLLQDSDGDRVGDALELTLGSDPVIDDRLCWFRPTYSLPGPAGPDAENNLVAFDVDTDGHVDLAWASGQRLWWYDDVARGTTSQLRTGQVSGAERLYPVDLDGDEHTDLLGYIRDDEQFTALRNDGDGQFTSIWTIPFAEEISREPYSTDLDADGRPELLVDGSDLWILTDIDGSEPAPTATALGYPDQVSDSFVADIDGDGWLDLFRADDDGVYLHLGLGDTTFATPELIASGAHLSIDLMDWTADGQLELVTSGTDKQFSVYAQADGAWSSILDGEVDLVHFGPEVGHRIDMDGDGDLDLVWTPAGSGSFGMDFPTTLWADNRGVDLPPRRIEEASPSWRQTSQTVFTAAGEAWFAFGGEQGVLLAALGAIDHDGDGLSLTTETCLTGTDTEVSDHDGGGVSDGGEVFWGSDPHDALDEAVVVDSDGDGLDDHGEHHARTDPTDTDTDDDGLLDGEEILLGTLPLLADSDGDGLDDPTEVDLGTDPLQRDSDGDGLDDPDELLFGTDPLLGDTDGDGATDEDEIYVWQTDPTLADPDTDADGLIDPAEDQFGSDPTLVDTDDDGLDDGDEWSYGTDPALADSDGDTLTDGAEAWVLGTELALADTRCRPWTQRTLDAPTGEGHVIDVRDVDDDGWNDLLALEEDEVVWYANEEGALGAGTVLATDAAWFDHGDLTGNGLIDLIVRHDDESLHLIEHQSPGQFAAAVAIGFAGFVQDVADADADGIDEVLFDGPSLALLQGVPGAWSLETVLPGGASSARLAQVDGDDDLEVISLDGDLLAYFASDHLGGGSWGPPTEIATSGRNGVTVAGDLDGDGDDDLTLTSSEQLQSWRNDDGVFTQWLDTIITPSISSPHLTDLDGDGIVDLVGNGVYPHDGIVFFEHVVAAAEPIGPGSGLALGLGDIDGDGAPDVISGDGEDWVLSRNPWAGDADGDGLLDGAESCIGTDPRNADSDGDGTDDKAELDALDDPRP